MRNSGMIGLVVLALIIVLALQLYMSGSGNVPEHSATHELGAGDEIDGVVWSANEDVGTATLTAGQTTVDATHDLGTASITVLISPTTDFGDVVGVKRCWVSAKTTANFTITCDLTSLANISWDWKAWK